nr:hypothetical protein CFP56_54902 [Quercus suber]
MNPENVERGKSIPSSNHSVRSSRRARAHFTSLHLCSQTSTLLVQLQRPSRQACLVSAGIGKVETKMTRMSFVVSSLRSDLQCCTSGRPYRSPCLALFVTCTSNLSVRKDGHRSSRRQQ